MTSPLYDGQSIDAALVLCTVVVLPGTGMLQYKQLAAVRWCEKYKTESIGIRNIVPLTHLPVGIGSPATVDRTVLYTLN